ncbi:hypothetical protein BSL78_03209 [Apostichopus japonicus]|uniref:Uncharacterized protein n=1 Tax=Stichopus japonicus TaxID=307972 RepID=A0A2G8LI33_STIJA|nr:hypothetical protein BSL78_03209 [Apostichopus japonicus]
MQCVFDMLQGVLFVIYPARETNRSRRSLADQNIKDRFYGTSDPVADKLMRRAEAMPKLEPPEDKTITTLYVGGLGDKVKEMDLNSVLSSLRMRDAAEMASEQSFQKLIIRGRRLNVKWGKSFAQQDDKKKIMEEGNRSTLYRLTSSVASSPSMGNSSQDSNNFFNLDQQPHLPQLPPRPPMGPPPLMHNFPPNLPPPPPGMHGMPPPLGGRPPPPMRPHLLDTVPPPLLLWGTEVVVHP